ncbi:MAG: DsbE family thiol:disulfide interchange protein [Alphaproteobacteria bacterium]
MSNRLIYMLPVVMACLMAVGFTYALISTDPNASRRTGLGAEVITPLPDFDPLPVLGGTAQDTLTIEALKAEQGVILVNVFASWCLPCKAEHPVLTQLVEEDDIPLYGLAWKDKPEDTSKWLEELGDPYKSIGVDLNGHAGISFGMNGVPETYIIARDGTIRYRHRGPLLPQQLEDFRAKIAEAAEIEP